MVCSFQGQSFHIHVVLSGRTCYVLDNDKKMCATLKNIIHCVARLDIELGILVESEGISKNPCPSFMLCHYLNKKL